MDTLWRLILGERKARSNRISNEQAEVHFRQRHLVLVLVQLGGRKCEELPPDPPLHERQAPSSAGALVSLGNGGRVVAV